MDNLSQSIDNLPIKDEAIDALKRLSDDDKIKVLDYIKSLIKLVKE